MRTISLVEGALHNGLQITPEPANSYLLSLPAAGGGVDLPALVNGRERYLVFYAEALTDHTLAMSLSIYTADAACTAMLIRFGLLPRLKTLICLDLNWLNGEILFPERNPGQLKLVCLGGRVERSDITRVVLENLANHCDNELRISDMYLADEPPASYPVPDIKMVDAFGQNKKKSWPDKIDSEKMLKSRLLAAFDDLGNSDDFAIEDWTTRFGGCKSLPLRKGTGFFGKAKHDERWYLVDPEGYAFFSVGVDCVGARADCRVDGIENLLDWLPAQDSEYSAMYDTSPNFSHYKQFSYEQANLYRVFGADWYQKWLTLMPRMLKHGGLNTIGNWSDKNLFACAKMPYVTQLPQFPTTTQLIFRDFPDVLSDEYAANAAQCAEVLRETADDPYMIGYFLRNEPAWAFVDDLLIADEVLRAEADTCCKAALIRWLTKKYQTIDKLNAAWAQHGADQFPDFAALGKLHARLTREADASQAEQIVRRVSAFSPEAHEDMRAFSRILLDAYVSVPTKACRAVDANHMVLGMRWAWVSNADLITGWENFDVFSINCYASDPLPSIDRVVNFGVDLPIMVGEFHFGALDRGPTATGLRAVLTQEERGVAYRYYCERLAAHPYGVGCHYFQCYDQFALGRFDGENYNIGLFDICSQPYAEMFAAMRETGAAVYRVMQKQQPAFDQQARFIPIIAF